MRRSGLSDCHYRNRYRPWLSDCWYRYPAVVVTGTGLRVGFSFLASFRNFNEHGRASLFLAAPHKQPPLGPQFPPPGAVHANVVIPR
jgi:hypothetical protein